MHVELNNWRARFPAAMTCLLIATPVLFGAANAHSGPLPSPGGYVVGNFGISSQIHEENDTLEQRIRVNPPKLGVWLQNFATGTFWLEAADGKHRRMALHPVSISKTYPEYSAEFATDEGVNLKMRLFAPLSLASKTNFIPITILQIELSSDKPWKGNLGYVLAKQANVEANSDDDPTPWPEAHRLLNKGTLSGGIRGGAFLAVDSSTPANTKISFPNSAISIELQARVGAGTSRKMTFLMGAYDSNGYYAREFPTADRMILKCDVELPKLIDEFENFKESLPSVGEPTLDRYIRWYTSAGILLTKGTRDGTVLTMGYVELNQRDSYWTSGIHLTFWEDLERKMILESAQGQRPSGRIPSTILPLIDRGDELDISEYFILRVSRFYHWYRDQQVLQQAWPAVQKAISYLASRDLKHVGVPEQTSYWADWKDVPAVEGRQFIPDVSLLWIASLKAAIEMAHELNDETITAQYHELLKKAEAFTNGRFDQGGLWDQSTYRERWADGRHRDNVLEDQVLGIYFNVVPAAQVYSIYKALEPNDTPWGVRETFPYRSGHYSTPWTEVDGTPGEYHNGGVWPYLNFVDAAGRFVHGRGEEAERMIRKIGDRDLAFGNNFAPGEFLNGATGNKGGSTLQAWDASLFSTIYFGEFGIERVLGTKMKVHVRTAAGRDFSTRLMLPITSGRLSSKAGALTWDADAGSSSMPVTVEVLDERWRAAK